MFCTGGAAFTALNNLDHPPLVRDLDASLARRSTAGTRAVRLYCSCRAVIVIVVVIIIVLSIIRGGILRLGSLNHGLSE